MGAMASKITSPTIVQSTVYSGADQRKHQSSASLALVRGIHRWPENSPHKGPVTRKMFPLDDGMMVISCRPSLHPRECVGSSWRLDVNISRCRHMCGCSISLREEFQVQWHHRSLFILTTTNKQQGSAVLASCFTMISPSGEQPISCNNKLPVV